MQCPIIAIENLGEFDREKFPADSLYNIKRIRPITLGPFDYDRSKPDPLQSKILEDWLRNQ